MARSRAAARCHVIGIRNGVAMLVFAVHKDLDVTATCILVGESFLREDSICNALHLNHSLP